jgi:HD-GYP domain-containing protein (c-di-GMP phosphodiesterase class II)
MSDKAFDKRNKEDFDKVTQVLLAGIVSIRSDSSLRATIAELARLTGVHRNTISNREWPQDHLVDIKEQRRRVAAARQLKVATREDPVSILTDKLEKSRLEVVYWFTQAKDAEDRFLSKERESKNFQESQNYYIARCEAQEITIAELRKEVQKLQRVVDVLESEAGQKAP